MPSAMIAETAAEATSIESKVATAVRTASAARVSFTMTLVTTPRVPSEPTATPARSYPGRSATTPPEREHLAGARDHLEAEDVVRHVPVLERVGPAGVGGGVPADRGDHLARGVRGEEVAAILHGAGQGEVDHARLHHGVAVPEVHLEDAVHAVDADHHAARRAPSPRRSAPCPSRAGRSGRPPPGSGAPRPAPRRSTAGARRGRACPCSRRACRTRRPGAGRRRRRPRRGPRSRGGRLGGGGPSMSPEGACPRRSLPDGPAAGTPGLAGGPASVGVRSLSGSSRCRRTSGAARCRPGRARTRRASPGRR